MCAQYTAKYTKIDIHISVYIYIYVVRRLSFPAPPPMVWSEGGGPGTQGGLRGLFGPSLHRNLNPKALQNPEPRPETSML